MANMQLVHRICELEDEVNNLRSRNHDLEERCLEFRRLSSLTNSELRDEWHDLVTLTMDLSKENKMLKNPPLDTWRQEIDKNISELKKVTEFLSAIHRKELDMIEAHEAIHRIHAEEIRRKQEANSEGESSE